MKEQFLKIVRNGDKEAILPFLQQLTDKQKKELAPVIRKEEKYLSETVQLSSNSFGFRGTSTQMDIVSISAFFCFNRGEGMKISPWKFPDEETLEILLPVYCPDWFADYMSSHEYFRIHYLTMMKWVESGYLPIAPPERLAGMVESYITNDNLEVYPDTLEEHFWYMFQYPTTLNWCQGNHWGIRIQELCKENKIDRLRVLKESLLALNRNFNKNLTNWFMDLFLELEPTTEELLLLQDELFAGLTCVQSKPVKCILDLIKKLIFTKGFRTDQLLLSVSLLMSSETKAVVNAALGVLQSLLKAGTPYRQELCRQLTAVFISKDESIQKKAATLLVQYAEPDEEIRSAIQRSEENLFSSTKTILKKWIPVPAKDEATTLQPAGIIAPQPLIREENAIKYPQTFEDFALFLNQAITLEEPYFPDVFMRGLIQWGNQVKADECVLLEPVIKKICKSLNTWYCEYMRVFTGSLLYIWCCDLERQYPGQMKKIMKLWDNLKDEEARQKKKHPGYPLKLLPLAALDLPHYYEGFRQVARSAQEKLQTGDLIPLLSTPTHSPAWIDPVALVKRLQQYQLTGKTPDSMDMQLAIQRCALDNTGEGLALAQKVLTGEIKELICFLLDKTAEPTGPFTYSSWWMTAAITHSPDTEFPAFGHFEYKVIPFVYFSASHSWEASRGPVYAELRIHTSGYKLREGNPLFIEYLLCTMVSHKTYSTAFSRENVPFFLFAIPNRPDILSGFIGSYYAECAYEIPEIAIGQAGVSAMSQLDIPFRSMDYLALAGYMIGLDKTVRDYASHLWIERVYQNRINNKELGKAIGKIEYIELFPLKRLTDLILNSLWNISGLHNRALLELIEAIVCESNPEPIKNMKKLLEIYKELLTLTEQPVSPEVIPMLERWKQTPLKKTVVSVLE
ncbi:MAG: DUF6493 family protein [Tannerellaceae bacterium]|nr:DUF6493 family protein [Tannerellaceae bacterium]